MRPFLQFLTDTINEGFDRLAKLLRLLNERPDVRVPIAPRCDSIAWDSVVRWHELGMDSAKLAPRRPHGHMLGWKWSGRHYDSFFVHLPEIAQLGRKVVIESWSCNIKQVHGFSASKSELPKFRSMDEMVERNSREMINEVSHQALARNLAHRRCTSSGPIRPTSSYCEATWSQSLPDWIGSHVHAFEHTGAAPAALVPDNLKSGVIKPCFYAGDQSDLP